LHFLLTCLELLCMELKTLRNRVFAVWPWQDELGPELWRLSSVQTLPKEYLDVPSGCMASNTLTHQNEFTKSWPKFFYFYYVKMLSGQFTGHMERSKHHSCITQRPGSSVIYNSAEWNTWWGQNHSEWLNTPKHIQIGWAVQASQSPQLLRQNPWVSLVPTMYVGFL